MSVAGRRAVCPWQDGRRCVSMAGQRVVCVCGGREGGVCPWWDRGSCVSVGEGSWCVHGGTEGSMCLWLDGMWCVRGRREGGVSVVVCNTHHSVDETDNACSPQHGPCSYYSCSYVEKTVVGDWLAFLFSECLSIYGLCTFCV